MKTQTISISNHHIWPEDYFKFDNWLNWVKWGDITDSSSYHNRGWDPAEYILGKSKYNQFLSI